MLTSTRWRRTIRGTPKEALQTLEATRKRRPYDRDILYALACIRLRRGDRETALGYAKQLQDLDPENSEYVRLTAQIENKRP